MVILTREQLEQRLSTLHQASLELVGVLSLDELLQRIVNLAREQAGAKYAALGLLDETGQIERFIPIGLSSEQVEQIGSTPAGKGMLGALMTARHPIRIPEIGQDPRSEGFPPNHPIMHPFLGVPIMSGDHLLGLIYLTDKEEHYEFTESDQRVIEILAAYAAVAISNAQLYQDVLERDQSLEKRNYSREDWFLSLLDKDEGHIITDIYLGFRQQPHFTIAVSKRKNGSFAVLRATLDPAKIYE